MELKGMFCAECGKEVKRDQLIKGLCIDCYRKSHTFFKIKRKPEIEICRLCYAYQIHGKWTFPSYGRDYGDHLEMAIREILTSAISSSPEGSLFFIDIDKESMVFGNKMIRVTAIVGGIFKDDPQRRIVEEKVDIEIKVKFTVCPRCTHIQRGTFEAIIQLRAVSPSKLKDLQNWAISTIEKIMMTRGMKSSKDYILEIKENKREGGIDIYLGSVVLARAVCQELKNKYGVKVIESRKLVKKRPDGNIYKYTFSVRPLPVERGDVVVLGNNKKYVVLEPTPARGKIHLYDLDTGKVENLPCENLWRRGVQILHGPHLQKKKCMVVSVSPDSLIVMDLNDYSTIEVGTPAIGDIREGDTVDLVKIDDTLYVLPNKLLEKKAGRKIA